MYSHAHLCMYIGIHKPEPNYVFRQLLVIIVAQRNNLAMHNSSNAQRNKTRCLSIPPTLHSAVITVNQVLARLLAHARARALSLS